MRIGATAGLILGLVTCLPAGGCGRLAGPAVHVVDADALHATLESRRGGPLLLVVFAGFDGGSDDVITGTIAAAKPADEGDSESPAVDVLLLGVDRLVVQDLDLATAQAERKVAACRATDTDLMIWSDSDPVALEGALPLGEGRRLTRRLPAVLGFDANGQLVDALTRDVSTEAIAGLLASLRAVAAKPPR